MSDGARPVDPLTEQPLPLMKQPGYYPGYSTLDQQAYWDDATRKVILDRVNNVPPIRFFDAKEVEILQAVCDRIMPQDDRLPERRIPLVNHIDAREYGGVIDGYRFEDMPPDGDAMKLGLDAVNRMARETYSQEFADLDPHRQDEALKSLHDCKPKGAHDVWERMPCSRFWGLLVQFIAEAYYAHPWAWDEIGFGGPAYPRGYTRLTAGLPEPWEEDEHRYEWEAPPDSLSGEYSPVGGPTANHPPPSQAGTH